jgi:hypothetical protein
MTQTIALNGLNALVTPEEFTPSPMLHAARASNQTTRRVLKSIGDKS